jgi:hypothetical protein
MATMGPGNLCRLERNGCRSAEHGRAETTITLSYISGSVYYIWAAGAGTNLPTAMSD